MEATLRDLARMVGGKVFGDDSVIIRGVSGIHEAGPGDITFIVGKKYTSFAKTSTAAAIIVEHEIDVDKPLLITDNSYLSFAKVSKLFSPKEQIGLGVSSLAVVDETAVLGDLVSIHPLVFIGKNTVIGNRTILLPGVVVGNEVTIGDECIIHPNVSVLNRCQIGNRVIVHSGTVIGSDGFGYVQVGNEHEKIPQVGIVQIDDDVEIGSNCSIDRATTNKTWIKKGVKIDNLVQVAHNVVIGENTLLIAQVGISGSTEIGDDVILAGQVGVAGHIRIGNKVRVGGQSGLHKDVEDGAVLSGSPAIPHRQWLRMSGYMTKLPELVQRINTLESRVRELEEKTVGG